MLNMLECSFGASHRSLLVTAWVFYRITGGLFNPAITLSLWLIGGLTAIRAVMLVVAQVAGGIAGAGLVQVIVPMGGVGNTITTLSPGMDYVQGGALKSISAAYACLIKASRYSLPRGIVDGTSGLYGSDARR